MRDTIRDDNTVPTAGCVVGDTIVELVYDPDKIETGLVVSRFGGLWNIERALAIHTGETLVPYSPRNNLIASGCVLLPLKPVPYGEKASLLAAIEAFVHKYVDLSPLFEKIAAHYVLLSWVHDAFSELPYLKFRGDYGTGKTRALLTVGALCYRPIFASGASTVSPLFHTLDRFGGTLILDEADFRLSDATSEIVKIFNNGHMKGLPVLRTMQTREREFNPRAFKVFGPKLVAMRGTFSDAALESRFLTEDMNLRSLRADIPVSLPPEFHAEAQHLRNQLLHYRCSELFGTKSNPEAVVDELEPRTNQIILPLLSLVDDEVLRLAIGEQLAQSQARRRLDRTSRMESKVLTILEAACAGDHNAPIPVGLITDRYNTAYGGEPGGPVAHKQIGHIIRKELQLATVRHNGVYVVPISEKPRIQALFARYAGVRSAVRPYQP